MHWGTVAFGKHIAQTHASLCVCCPSKARRVCFGITLVVVQAHEKRESSVKIAVMFILAGQRCMGYCASAKRMIAIVRDQALMLISLMLRLFQIVLFFLCRPPMFALSANLLLLGTCCFLVLL